MNRIPDLHRKYYKTSRNYNYDKVEAKEKGREGILGIWDLRRKKKRGKEGERERERERELRELRNSKGHKMGLSAFFASWPKIWIPEIK